MISLKLTPNSKPLILTLCTRGSINLYLNLHHARIYKCEHKRRGILICVHLYNSYRFYFQSKIESDREKLHHALQVHAARFSKKPLDGGVGNRAIFQKPFMQQSPSEVEPEEQLKGIEAYLKKVKKEVDSMKRQSMIPKNETERKYRKEKLDFLLDEVKKYWVYVIKLSYLYQWFLWYVYIEGAIDWTKILYCYQYLFTFRITVLN